MKGIAIASCVIFLLACRGNGQEEDLMPREQFKEVLTEAYLLEARRNHAVTLLDMQQATMDEWYEELFESHGTTTKAFQKTFTHYAEHHEEMHELLEEILIILQQRKDMGNGEVVPQEP